MPTDAERAEIRRLQEQIYGAAGRTDPDAVARLEALIAQDAVARAPSTPAVVAEPTPEPVEAEPADEDSAVAEEAVSRPRRRPPTWALIVGAVVLGGMLFGAEFVAARTTAPAADDDAAIPELARPQTEEDEIGFETGVDPSSTRFVAIVDGYFIYLGIPTDYDGVCIVTYDASNRESLSNTCTGTVDGFGGLLAQVNDFLSVGLGNVDAMTPRGDPLEVSESVTVFVVR